MNINNYRAKQMHDFFREGKSIVKDEDIVFNVLHNSKEVMKTEEIVKAVEFETALDHKDAISFVSSNLAAMERKGMVAHIKHGYWKVAQNG